MNQAASQTQTGADEMSDSKAWRPKCQSCKTRYVYGGIGKFCIVCEPDPHKIIGPIQTPSAMSGEQDRRDRASVVSILLASYTASANSQLDRGGWQCDWDELMNPLRQELHELLDESTP